MKTRIQKWGNSLAVRLPKVLTDQIGLHPDVAVDISAVEGRLIITPLTDKLYSLDQFLNQIDETKLHGEVDTGHPIGNEVW